MDPHGSSRKSESLITVMEVKKFCVFVPENCVVSTSLTEILDHIGDADFAYADSFHFDPNDPSQFTHQLRPGWSPERLRGHCYVGDVVIATKKLVKKRYRNGSLKNRSQLI
jgi:hypothetical protein